MTHPYPPRSEQRCGNCYYHCLGNDCHRYAPRPVLGLLVGYESYWPDVCDGEWCGEWAPKEVSK